MRGLDSRVSCRINPEEFRKVLTNFALFVTLPPFIFINILKASKNTSIFNWEFIIKFEITTIIIIISSFLISLFLLKNNNKESSLFALNSSYPNYGYMGIPLCILAFGETAVIPISLILLFDTIILLSFTSYFVNENNKNNFLKRFFTFILNMFKNPILLSVFIGFFFIIFDINVNYIIFQFIENLSLAATPTALFAVGINLLNKIEKKILPQVSLILLFKLIIHPLIIFIIFYTFPSNIPLLWIKVAILCSSLPVAGNVFAMSVYYNVFSNITSNSILITTVLSTISVPIILYLLI